MATKTIQTRIKNRFDTLANWQGADVTLLPGEIALVSVTTKQIDKDTGDVVNVPAVLMKVGESDGNGGTKAFNDLPWVSALAADVYDWAKGPAAEDVVVKYNTDSGSEMSTTLLGIFKDLEEAKAAIAALKTGKLDDITVEMHLSAGVGSHSDPGVITLIEKDDIGKIQVTKGLVVTGAIADKAVTTIKIADKNVTTDKIKDGAVTNEKVAPGISSDKINVTLDNDDGTLTDRIGDIKAQIASINSSIANGVNFLGTTATNVADDKNKTNKKVIMAVNSEEVTAVAGDIVIFSETGREFIWNGSIWEELGDATRAGALETLVAGLEETQATSNEFVTHISKSTDGKTFVVNKAQPTSTDIKHGTNSTVNKKLGEIDAEIAAIESNYVKFVPDASDETKGKLYVGKSDTTNVVIFDCGGAADIQ